MSKKRYLADALWRAANEHLSDTEAEDCAWQKYSCDAVYKAFCWDDVPFCKALQFLQSLGCQTEAYDCFRKHAEGPKRQGVRYMWLLLAMHVAEDEGITV